MDLLDALVPKLGDLLDPPALAAIESSCRWQNYRAGTRIHHRGERSRHFSLIRAGHVNGSNVDIHGSTLSSSVLGPGDCFGEFTIFAGLPRTHDIWALDAVELGTIGADRFRQLSQQHPAIATGLLTIALRRNYVMLEFLDSIRRLPLEVRLAKLLLVNVWSETDQTISIRQESLAYTFGVSRMSVSTALSKLERAGLVTRGYRKIRLNRNALSRWVNEHDLVPPVLPDDLVTAFRAKNIASDTRPEGNRLEA